jgi:hypothetical protein
MKEKVGICIIVYVNLFVVTTLGESVRCYDRSLGNFVVSLFNYGFAFL